MSTAIVEFDWSALAESKTGLFKKTRRAFVEFSDTLRMHFAELTWTLEDFFNTFEALKELRVLQRGREEGAGPMINNQGIHLNTEYHVRLKGKDDGGWKGNPKHIGTLMICGTPDSEKVIAIDIETIAPLGTKFILQEVVRWPQANNPHKEIAIEVANGTGRFSFEIYREDHDKLISYVREEDKIRLSSRILDEMGIDTVFSSPATLAAETYPVTASAPTLPEESAANGIGAFAHDIDMAMETIPCEISSEGRELMSQFEELMNQPRETTYGPRSKAYAIALIRRAVQHPGKPVDIRPPTFLSTNAIMRHLVRGLLDITGLREYSNMGTNAIVVYRPNELEGAAAYGYARAREPFLIDPAEFNMPIPVPLTASEKVKANKNELPGYDEALKISKMCEGTNVDAAEKALRTGF